MQTHMLPGLRTFLFSALATLVGIAGALSLLALYLPTDAPRERSAPARAADPHRTRALEARATARRYEELARLIRIGPADARADRSARDDIVPITEEAAAAAGSVAAEIGAEPATSTADAVEPAATPQPPEIVAEPAAPTTPVAVPATVEAPPIEPAYPAGAALALLDAIDATELLVQEPQSIADATPPANVEPAQEQPAQEAPPEITASVPPTGATLPPKLSAPRARPVVAVKPIQRRVVTPIKPKKIKRVVAVKKPVVRRAAPRPAPRPVAPPKLFGIF